MWGWVVKIRSGGLRDCGGHRCLLRIYINRPYPEPSDKLSIGFARRWFGLYKHGGDLTLFLLGLRLHWRRSFGGQFGGGS